MSDVLALKSALAVALVAGLAGCATDAPTAPSALSSSRYPVPGAATREGGSIATMADQYAHPRAGGTAAAGASSWVPAAPAPAFVATGPAPPAAPPTPPPAAAASRQPAAPAQPAVDAADIVRPEAQQPEPPAPAPSAAPARPAQPAGLSAADLAKARTLFADLSCGACHALADAGSSGGVGPGLDRNPNLTREFIVATLKEGRGPMPSFSGQLTDPDMGTLAEYILQVARK